VAAFLSVEDSPDDQLALICPRLPMALAELPADQT
jgi:hypothetical protein